MRNPSISGSFSGREERLLGRSMGEDNRPLIQRLTSDAQHDLSRTLQNFTDPDAVREQKLNDVRDQLQAFQSPDIFTAPANGSLAAKGGNKERLLAMTPTRRLEEFTAFINTQIPEAVRAKYVSLFGLALNEQDIFEYEQQSQDGRIRIMLTALASLSGTKVTPGQNPIADMLALDIAAEKNNAAASPGSVAFLYSQWLDSQPGISETDATTPEFLLRSGSGIPDRLRGDLQNIIDPAVQKSMLMEMYELYRNREINDNLTFEQAKVDQLQLTGSVEKKKLEREARGLVENFRNADPRLQLAMGVIGAVAVWQIFKAKNPIGRWALAGGVGYFAYDRFINGNENALNDMGKGVSKFAATGGNMLKNLARELGLPIPRNQQDKLELMAEFITKNRLNIPGHEAMTGMSALAGVKLGTIAAAFNPSMDGEQLGGNLIIDDGQNQFANPSDGTQFVSLGGQRQVDVSGNLLHKSLMLQMGGMGLNAREKANTIAYLQNNNASVTKAFSHACYMLAMDETKNVKRSENIESALVDYGTYDNLPITLKQQYMEIVLQGKALAETIYKNSSLVDVIANLVIRRKNKVEKKDDPAVEIPDPKTPGRSKEFALIGELPSLPLTTSAPIDVLKDGGLSEEDTKEFLRNCEASGIIDPDAALELARRFDKVRRETPTLTEALQIIEKMKYAVLVQSTRQETQLTQADIILLVGPDDLSATSILNRVTGFLGRFGVSLPGRGFGTVSSLGDVRSLITEPWFGSGPTQSQGEGFKRLTDRMNVYDKKLADMKDIKLTAKTMAGALPDSVATAIGSRAKLEEVLLGLLPASNYNSRINRAEQQLSQRMANALSRTMRLTHESDGFGRFDDLGVTPTEQKNLVSEFDLLFIDTLGDPLRNMGGMWQRVEDIDTYRKFDRTAIDAQDYTNETKRLELQAYAKDLAILHAIRKMFGTTDDAARQDMGERVLKIRDNIKEQKRLDIVAKTKVVLNNPYFNATEREALQAENLKQATIIENRPSYRVQDFEDLANDLKILEMSDNVPNPTFRDLMGPDLFPPTPPSPANPPVPPSPANAPTSNPANAPVSTPANAPVGPSPANAPVGPSIANSPTAKSPANAPVGPSPANAPVGPSIANAPIAQNPANAPVLSNPANAPVGPSVANAPTAQSPANAPVLPNAANAPVGPSPANAPVGPSLANAPIIPNTLNTPRGLQNLQDAIDALGLRGFLDVRLSPSGQDIDYSMLPFTSFVEPKDIATSSAFDIESLGSDAQTIVRGLNQKIGEWHANLSDMRRQEFVATGNSIQMDALRYVPDLPSTPSSPGVVPPNLDAFATPPPPNSPGPVPLIL